MQTVFQDDIFFEPRNMLFTFYEGWFLPAHPFTAKCHPAEHQAPEQTSLGGNDYDG